METQFSKTDVERIMSDVRKTFDSGYINRYIMDNFYNYCDAEEMDDANYEDEVEYYTETGAGGNGIEYDLLDEMWQYIREKHGIDLMDDTYEDLRYSLDYYIKEFFPHFYFRDYRIKSDLDKMMDRFDSL